MKTFDPSMNTKAWVFTIARNALLTIQRRPISDRIPLALDENLVLVSPEADPAKAIEQADYVWWVLGQLDDRDREVIDLKVVKGMTLQDISEILGLSVPAVASRVLAPRSAARDS